MKSRITFLSVAAILLLCVFLSIGKSEELPAFQREPLSRITIITASDLHYLSPALTDRSSYFEELIENADGKTMMYSDELAQAFVEQIIKQSPDALILSGDLTFNGAIQSHLDLKARLQDIKDAGISVFVLPGNHDLENPMAASFQEGGYVFTDSVTAAQFEDIYSSFGYCDALEKDNHSLSYTVELLPNFRLLMVDTNTVEAPGEVTERTLLWVEQQLKDAAQHGAWVLAVSHQNLMQHNSVFSDGYVIKNADRLLTLYERYGVLCNLSGHVHIQHIAQSERGTPEIVTSSLAVSPNQYGVLSLEGTAADYQTKPVDVSAWAAENGLSDPELLDFANYSRCFFWNTAYRQAAAEFGADSSNDALASIFADVNTAYFAGCLNEINLADDLLSEWKKQSSFLSVYLQSIMQDAGNNYNTFAFEFQEAP